MTHWRFAAFSAAFEREPIATPTERFNFHNKQDQKSSLIAFRLTKLLAFPSARLAMYITGYR
jgi:hypothetical protein